MKQVPCMIEGNHCLINGLLTIDQKGWGHSVTAIGKDKKGWPGEVIDCSQDKLRFFIVRNKVGVYVIPQLDQPDQGAYYYQSDANLKMILKEQEGEIIWGYCNANTGAIIIQPVYEFVAPNDLGQSEEIAVVQKNGYLGTIDAAGQVCLDFIYDGIQNLKEILIVLKDGCYGLFSRNGKEMIPVIYDELEIWDNYHCFGYVKVRKNGKAGLISLKNEKILDCFYDELKHRDQYSEFLEYESTPELAHETLPFGLVIAQKNGKWGMVNLKNQVVIDFSYDALNCYDLRKNLLVAVRDGKKGIIDLKGRPIIDFCYEDIQAAPLQDDVIVAKRNGKWGMLNGAGEIRIDFIYDQIRDYQWQWDRAIVKKGRYSGITDFSGNILLKCRYLSLSPCFSWAAKEKYSGYYGARTKNGWGLMNNEFEFTISPKYIMFDDIFTEFPFYKIWAIDDNDDADKYKLENLNGSIGSGIRYDDILELRQYDSNKSDLTKVVKEGRFGLLDGSGRELVPPQYDWIDLEYQDGLVVIKKNGLYGYLDRCGNEVIAPVYEEAEEFHDGVALIKKEGLYGYIDVSGNYLLEPCLKNRARSFKAFLKQNGSIFERVEASTSLTEDQKWPGF